MRRVEGNTGVLAADSRTGRITTFTTIATTSCRHSLREWDFVRHKTEQLVSQNSDELMEFFLFFLEFWKNIFSEKITKKNHKKILLKNLESRLNKKKNK